MKSLEDLEKKINSELTTKINNTEIKIIVEMNYANVRGTKEKMFLHLGKLRFKH